MDDDDEEEDRDDEPDIPFGPDDTPFMIADAGVVAGGDGVASLSTLFAL